MDSQINRQSLVSKYLTIFVVVAAYWFTSIITVFVNKALLSSNTVDLDAPLFVTWSQCVVSAIICFVMSQLSQLFPNTMNFPKGNPLQKDSIRKVLPLSIIFTLMIASNNLCLKYVGIAFYYVGRSLTTVFNVIFSYILLKQTTSLRCICCCIAIITGFWLGVDQESLTESFSLIGTIYGIIGSLSLSLYSIYTKKTLQYVNQDVLLLSYFINIYSSILFMPLILINGEINVILHYKHLYELWFWCALWIGGLCGFLIGITTALQIKVTSPLTHNISGTAKSCAQTVLATQWFNEPKTFLWWLSNIIVLSGSALYARFKQIEMKITHKTEILNRKV